MKFTEALRIVLLHKYADVRGRAGQPEFWWFVLFSFSVSMVASTLGEISGWYYWQLLATLALIVPWVAVSVRRLHDTDRTGWWMLLGLVPIFGPIVLLVFFCQDSQPMPNKYGLPPKPVAGWYPQYPSGTPWPAPSTTPPPTPPPGPWPVQTWPEQLPSQGFAQEPTDEAAPATASDALSSTPQRPPNP